jgi:hypothetical protein
MLPLLKRKIIASSLALMLISAAVASAAQPAVLQQVPDDAAVVVVVKNLKQLTTKLTNAGTRMKLPAIPEDLLATIMGRFGISDGLDQNGSLAYALLDLGKGDQRGMPPFVIIVPTTDSKAMLKSLDSEAPDATGIMKVTLPNEPDPGYAVVAGKYLVIAPESASLTRFLAHTGTLDKKISPESAAAFDANDIVLYANIPAFGPKTTDQIDSGRDLMSMQMAMNNTMDKTTSAILDEVIGSMFDLTKEALKDSTAALVTFRLNDESATFGGSAQFKPDSPIGKFVAAQKAAPPATLTGLPDGKILVAAATNWDKNSIGPVFNKFVDQVLANPDIKENPQLADIKKMMEAEKGIFSGFSGEKIAFYAPTDPANGWINAVIIADLDDPQKSIDAAMLMTKLNLGTDAQGMKVQQKVEPNAKTVNGVSLMKQTATYILKEDAPPQAAAGLEMLNKLYGPNGMVAYYGVVGKQLVAVMGSDDKLLESAITAAQAADTALAKNPEIAAASKAALPNSIMVEYLPVTRWISLALSQLHMGPAEAADKPAATPITVSASVTGSTITTEMTLPMTTVIDLSTTIQENLSNILPH